MKLERLKQVAEHIENGLLEKLAIGKIDDYAIEIVPDDMQIMVSAIANEPIGTTVVTLNVASNIKKDRLLDKE